MTEPVTTSMSAKINGYLFEWMTRTSPKVQNVPISFRFDIERILMKMHTLPAADQISETRDHISTYVENFLHDACPEKIVYVNVIHEIERMLRDH